MGAETHLVLVHGEVNHAAAKLKELLPRVPVAPVLLDGVLHRLLGQAVLKLKGGDGQTVDEKSQVERELGLVPAVAELTGDAETILAIEPLSLHVTRRRRAVEEVQVVRTVLDPVAQHVYGAALGDLTLQASWKLAPGRAVLLQPQRLGGVRLRLAQEGRELGQVHAVFAVVVLGIAADPADAVGRRLLVDRVRCSSIRTARITGRAGQRRADQPFQPAFAGVGGHAASLPIKQPSSKAIHPAHPLRQVLEGVSLLRALLKPLLPQPNSWISSKGISPGDVAICGGDA